MRKKIWELMKKDDTMLHATLQIPTINIVTLKLLKYWNFWFSVYSDLCYSLICSVDQQGTSFQQCTLDLSLTMMRVSNIHPHFVTRNQDIWIYESWKQGITLCYRINVWQVLFRRLENSELSLRYNISTTARPTDCLLTSISLVSEYTMSKSVEP